MSSTAVDRINTFLETISSEEQIAKVILDAFLQERISLNQANELSLKYGIAGPLTYWAGHDESGFIKLPNGDAIRASHVVAIRIPANSPYSDNKDRVIVDYVIYYNGKYGSGSGNSMICYCNSAEEAKKLQEELVNELDKFRCTI